MPYFLHFVLLLVKSVHTCRDPFHNSLANQTIMFLLTIIAFIIFLKCLKPIPVQTHLNMEIPHENNVRRILLVCLRMLDSENTDLK